MHIDNSLSFLSLLTVGILFIELSDFCNNWRKKKKVDDLITRRLHQFCRGQRWRIFFLEIFLTMAKNGNCIFRESRNVAWEKGVFNEESLKLSSPLIIYDTVMDGLIVKSREIAWFISTELWSILQQKRRMTVAHSTSWLLNQSVTIFRFNGSYTALLSHWLSHDLLDLNN